MHWRGDWSFQGGITSIKIFVSGDQFIQSGGQSVSRSLVRGDCFKGGPNLSWQCYPSDAIESRKRIIRRKLKKFKVNVGKHSHKGFRRREGKFYHNNLLCAVCVHMGYIMIMCVHAKLCNIQSVYPINILLSTNKPNLIILYILVQCAYVWKDGISLYLLCVNRLCALA